ncbi:hypothetical protein EIP86_004000 [Pleurotus ostreatoroseus]|nr:hypothetical protein EIP86_004000 [Pleurotus ostreatoroseus]
MFIRFHASFVCAVSTLAVLAVATPWGPPPPPTTTATTTTTVTVTAPASTPTTSGQCNTGPIQCCNEVKSASDPAASALLGLLGIVLSDLDVLVGLTCSPITIIGAGSGSCSANAVCCENNSFEGLISIGCLPVDL